DASHELRTPLASIRGYAELFRIGAVRDPAGSETAMRRIEQESKRMGVLVEELLALARLEERPDRDLEPVDLTAPPRDPAQRAGASAGAPAPGSASRSSRAWSTRTTARSPCATCPAAERRSSSSCPRAFPPPRRPSPPLQLPEAFLIPCSGSFEEVALC